MNRTTRRPFLRIFTLSLFLLSPLLAAPEPKTVDGVTYHILTASADRVKVNWQDAHGRPLKTFPETAQHFARLGIRVETLMNGGIFEPGGIPSGLLIQDGKELRPLNRNPGKGNFFLQPNGVFLISSKGAAVVRTDEFPFMKTPIRYAVQSGPMLLSHGKIHPAFTATSTSRLHRNGVGIDKAGKVVLAMTDPSSPMFPNLHEFAQLFLKLGCEDALFLDGSISQMRSGKEINLPSNPFGSVIAITEGL